MPDQDDAEDTGGQPDASPMPDPAPRDEVDEAERRYRREHPEWEARERDDG